VYFQLGLAVLCSVFSLNSGILTVQKYRTIAPSAATNEDSTAASSKKDKRGVFGFGVHGHHGYAPHYDDYAHNHNHHPHHNHHSPPLPPHHPPATHPVNLGAHFHTTVTKKIGIPIPYPYPVKVRTMILKIIAKLFNSHEYADYIHEASPHNHYIEVHEKFIEHAKQKNIQKSSRILF
jgi:hypothetical protein